MRESEFRERLKDVHHRSEGRVAVDNRVLLQQLHPEAA
jgi:hypothetical protein